ncbi:MAG: signal peptidase I [Cyanobacteria bacterium P01_D01_bin.123]
MPISSSKPRLKLGFKSKSLLTRFSRVVVRGESMAPTLVAGDRLFVLQRCRTYVVGDIIVFANASQPYIKRVVGVPGQHVEWHGIPWQLAADEYFALGDCETVSIDSRTFGPIPHCNIIGRAIIKYFPTISWLQRSRP